MNMYRLQEMSQAARILLTGGVGVVPTDTVYGVVARAADESAVGRLYALKRRESKPGTMVAASVEQLLELGVPEGPLRWAERWWPAALSVVLPVGEALGYLHQGVGSLAVRIPAHDGFRGFLEQTGPLMTSSANWPGEPTAVTVHEAGGYFGDRVDFYVDGGNLTGRPGSTVVRLHESGLEVLRQGAVKVTALDEA